MVLNVYCDKYDTYHIPLRNLTQRFFEPPIIHLLFLIKSFQFKV